MPESDDPSPADESVDLDLTRGDFVYQSDQELFLVVTDISDETVTFAAHGWRELPADRVKQYLDADAGRLHRQESIDEVVRTDRSTETQNNYDNLKQLFSVYSAEALPADGPQSSFTLDAEDRSNQLDGSDDDNE